MSGAIDMCSLIKYKYYEQSKTENKLGGISKKTDVGRDREILNNGLQQFQLGIQSVKMYLIQKKALGLRFLVLLINTQFVVGARQAKCGKTYDVGPESSFYFISHKKYPAQNYANNRDCDYTFRVIIIFFLFFLEIMPGQTVYNCIVLKLVN